MPITMTDIRHAARSLSREPASAAIAVLTLALGIGLCTIAFTLLYGVFFRGLDIPQADRVRLIWRVNPTRDPDDMMGVPQHDFYDLRERQQSFIGLARISGGGTVNLSDSLGPERFEGAFVSANTFDLLGVRPILGTTFRPADDEAGAPLTLILSHRVWIDRYRGDSAIIGRSIKVNGEHATVLGVMPPGFLFPNDQYLWVPQRDTRAASPRRDAGPSSRVFGRLKDGIAWDQAQAEMATIAASLAREYPETNRDITIAFQTFQEDSNGPEIVAVFSGMQLATILVLLIACANVANLLLARATMRTREAAVRTAIGASPLRVVAPFFAETLVLAAVGALIGTGIAYVGVALFDRATSDVGKPYFMIFTLDAPILAFVVGVTLFTALVAGAAPAVQILRTNLSSTLKDESRGTSGMMGRRVSRALVITQMAFSCALLVGAGLMIKSIARLRNYQYPFATETVFTARVQLPSGPQQAYADTLLRRAFWDRLHERLEALPGVAAAALTTDIPGGPSGSSSFEIEGVPYTGEGEHPQAGQDWITPGYFQTFEVPMISGRAFTAQDRAGALAVTIINQDLAERYFQGEDPIGRRIRPGELDTTQQWLTIVGVAPTMVVAGLSPDEDNTAEYFRPVAQRNPSNLGLAVRVSGGDPMVLTPPVRQVLASLDPDLPIYQVNSLAAQLEQETWFFRVFGTLFIVFGAAALFMASVGLYGVLAFSVSRRVREMGIRMALGASAPDVVRLILRQGAVQTTVGLGIGLALAFGLTRVIGFVMFDVNPNDPLVFLAIAVVIAGVGLAASWIPARRATAVDPVEALRYE